MALHAATPRPDTASSRTPAAIADDFPPPDMAAGMRRHIDAHFASPNIHRAETHQV